MMTSNISTLFLSYSHTDKQAARSIYSVLTKSGFNVFLDEIRLEPEQHLRVEIMQSINSSDCFLLLWSKNARTDWVKWEIEHAIARSKVSNLRILVAALDKSDRPVELQDYLYVDMYESFRVGSIRLVSHLSNLSEKVIPFTYKEYPYQIDIENIHWHINNSSKESLFRLAFDDQGLFALLNNIYAVPPQVGNYELEKPLESTRMGLIEESESQLLIAELIASVILEGELKTVATEGCRFYLSWAVQRAFHHMISITRDEFKNIPRLWKNRIENINLLNHDLSDGCIELLSGSEKKYSGTEYKPYDLLLKKSLSLSLGIQSICVRMPSAKANRIIEEQAWPPASHILDLRSWGLGVIPWIARELQLAMERSSYQLLDKPVIRSAFSITSYDELGLH